MNDNNRTLASQFADLLGWVVIIATLVTVFAGCEVVEFIFKAGMVVGIVLIVGIVWLVVFIMKKLSGRRP
jgi:hypothetical protein